MSSSQQPDDQAVTLFIPDIFSSSLRIRSLAEEVSSEGNAAGVGVMETIDYAWVGMEKDVCAAAQSLCMDMFVKKRQTFSIKGVHCLFSFYLQMF